MNEINARPVQHLATNNLSPTALFYKKLIDLAILADQATMILKVAKALVRHIQLEVGGINHQACTPSEQGVTQHQSLSLLAKLTIQVARKPEEEKGHLIGTIKRT